MPQVAGKVKVPAGKKVAVNVGCDFDAQAIWIGSFNLTSPAYMSRGEFCAEVAVPRLLKLFESTKLRQVGASPDTLSTHGPRSAKRFALPDTKSGIMAMFTRTQRQ